MRGTSRKRRALGQHFLVDEGIAAEIVRMAKLSGRERVLEIGPGYGTLTKFLCYSSELVYAVEKDKRLSRYLRRKPWKNLVLIEGDALKIDFPEVDKLVSNPPFSISSGLIFKFLEEGIEEGVITLQREFAHRLTAEPGSREYGRLTLATKALAKVEILGEVPRECFSPPPKVEISLVRITRRNKPLVENKDVFLDVVKALFIHRGKKVKNSFEKSLPIVFDVGKSEVERIIREIGPLSQRKVYSLTLDEVREISEVVASVLNRDGLRSFGRSLSTSGRQHIAGKKPRG